MTRSKWASVDEADTATKQSTQTPSRQGSAGADEADPLVVKVLRLPRPLLNVGLDAAHPTLPALPGAELLLPRSAQPVYVGEEFRSIVTVQLRGKIDPGSAHLRADVESPESTRVTIVDTALKFTDDAPWVSQLVTFELTTPGPHTLVVTIRYGADGEARAFRRLFRFETAPAIRVRTKISHGSQAMKAHILEAQVENLSESALTIENCAFVAANNWEVQGVAEEPAVLRPRDTWQWSFILRHGTAAEAGHLAVGWRREPLGAEGWQTTGTIRI